MNQGVANEVTHEVTHEADEEKTTAA